MPLNLPTRKSLKPLRADLSHYFKDMAMTFNGSDGLDCAPNAIARA